MEVYYAQRLNITSDYWIHIPYLPEYKTKFFPNSSSKNGELCCNCAQSSNNRADAFVISNTESFLGWLVQMECNIGRDGEAVEQ